MSGALGTSPVTHQLLDTAIMSVDPQTQKLFAAIAAINYSQVKQAIEAGISLNTPNERGQTPLAVACHQGNLEIVDLLIAAGAKMHVQENPSPSTPSGTLSGQSPLRAVPNDDHLMESPLRDRSIAYNDLTDFMHQPEIDRLPSAQSSMPQSTAGQNFGKARFNRQEITTDAETTYTFDLDEVFAQKDSPITQLNLPQRETPTQPDLNLFQNGSMFVDGELTMTSINRSLHDVALESSETYAFDLSPDLDRLTAEAPDEADRLSMPMGEWDEGETYAIDLDNFDGLGLELDLVEADGMADVAHLFLMNDDRFEHTGTYEEGETYAIDLDELTPRTDLTFSSDRHSTSKMEEELFPTVDNEDGTEFDLDNQNTTDILGKHKTDQDRVAEMRTVDNECNTNTSLMAAVIDGDLELTQQAIDAGANLDRYDWHLGYSPLGMAIDRGYTNIVKCLLAAGANPYCGSTATTALGLAAERGELEIIEMLLARGVDINQPIGQDHWTALLSAIQNGHRSVVQLLVTTGANVNIWSRGETPILLAAKCEEREIYNYLYPLVNISIRLYADRDGEQLLQSSRKRRIREQNRPIEKLITMAIEGNLDEVKRAIEIGIEIDELGAQGHTALMAAAYYGHKSIVKVLLAAGADPHLLSDDVGLGQGMTALMLAAGSFFAHNRQAVVKLLLSGGADVNQQGAGGKTAIMYAALAGSGYQDCVETLIAAGADLDLRDDRGQTVVTLVAAAENYQILNLLIQAGGSTTGLESIQLIQAAASGNVQKVQSLLTSKINLDLDRGAAIGNAAAAGYTQIVKLLIHAGANVNLSNRAGFTPLASAAYAGYGEIVQLLIDAGAHIQAPTSEYRSYSALEYAQMGLYQFEREDLQHAQIIRLLEQLEQQ